MDSTGTAIAQIRALATGEEVAAQIREAGGGAVAVEVDLSQQSTVGALFDRAESDLGPVSVAISHADHCVRDTLAGGIGGDASAPG